MKKSKNVLVLWFTRQDIAFTTIERDAKFETGCVKEVPFVNRKYTKGVPFQSKMVYKRVGGRSSGRSPPVGPEFPLPPEYTLRRFFTFWQGPFFVDTAGKSALKSLKLPTWRLICWKLTKIQLCKVAKFYRVAAEWLGASFSHLRCVKVKVNSVSCFVGVRSFSLTWSAIM